MMKLADSNIEYRISPRRKSIALMVTPEGGVVVTMPRGTSQESLARALEKHGDWLERTVAERRAAWGRLKPGEVYLSGEAYKLTVLKGMSGAVTLDGKEIRVPLSNGADPWFRLVAWYGERAFGLLQKRVNHFATTMGLTPGPVELKEWKRRWGECHPDGTLKFNWRLIMCPPKIIDYVVVHELAHLVVPGHNPRFWGVVAKALPDWAARRQWLNQKGTPFLHWRIEF